MDYLPNDLDDMVQKMWHSNIPEGLAMATMLLERVKVLRIMGDSIDKKYDFAVRNYRESVKPYLSQYFDHEIDPNHIRIDVGDE